MFWTIVFALLFVFVVLPFAVGLLVGIGGFLRAILTFGKN